MEINLKGIQETLLIPLWTRAKFSKEDNSILIDKKSISIVEKIQYDFTRIDKYPYVAQLQNIVRTKILDDTIKDFLKSHPKATIINLGAGLDTTFYRVDNGLINWYDIDLPDVMEIRKKLIPETERSHYIAESIFEMQWLKHINKNEDGVLFIAGGVLEYFKKDIVKKFIIDLADNFPGSEIVFNTIRKNVIMTFFQKMIMPATIKWGNKDIDEIKQWDKRIVILEYYPLFSKINMDKNWNKTIMWTINFINKWKGICIVHLGFLNN